MELYNSLDTMKIIWKLVNGKSTTKMDNLNLLVHAKKELKQENGNFITTTNN